MLLQELDVHYVAEADFSKMAVWPYDLLRHFATAFKGTEQSSHPEMTPLPCTINYSSTQKENLQAYVSVFIHSSNASFLIYFQQGRENWSPGHHWTSLHNEQRLWLEFCFLIFWHDSARWFTPITVWPQKQQAHFYRKCKNTLWVKVLKGYSVNFTHKCKFICHEQDSTTWEKSCIMSPVDAEEALQSLKKITVLMSSGLFLHGLKTFNKLGVLCLKDVGVY